MQFIGGCRDNVTKTCSKDSTNHSNDADDPDNLDDSDIRGKRPPVTFSAPCPFENISYFMTREMIIPRENTSKYYLVDMENGTNAKPRIYLLDDRETIGRVHRWLVRNGEELEKKSNVANLPQIFPWHNELLQYAKNGDAVSYIADYAEPEEYKKLAKMFRDRGSQVETMPGRKPPLIQGLDGQFPIEWIFEASRKRGHQ
jgi:hypothetical protein